MLSVFVLIAAASMLAGLLSPFVLRTHPAAHVHLVLALGMMPLIMAAMTHFVPVLTRSRAATAVLRAPLLGAAGGVVIVAWLIWPVQPLWRSIAAALALAGCLWLAVWQWRRRQAALGGAHPGVDWYLAALACLGLGLLAVLAMAVWPAHYPAIKRLHAHLNLFGFVGLTAVGTLQVLLPTTAGQGDPEAAQRLHADLPVALAGAMAIALGAAWWSYLSILGMALWLFPLARIGKAWFNRYRGAMLDYHGATPLLAGALAGFVLTLLAGAAHGMAWLPAANVGHLFVFAFLFPLVSGAAGYLLPLWLRPGVQMPWHEVARSRLTYGSAARFGLFATAAVLALAGWPGSAAVALTGLLPFAVASVWTVIQSRR
ncbi:MAG: hypothetical protein Q8O37_11010 [Sulfuricellaceae bacterium]|nr:hypothetical protein [Sulfuricellaceae bacterium]